jgi:CubicO group peptidase (beta-lactamase class C family)
MDPAPLVALRDAIRAHGAHFLHSVLVARNGRLVFEEYFDGRQFDLVEGSPWEYEPVSFGINTLQFQGSVSKSITSALVGIALDRGLIPDVDATLFSFFPDYQELSTPQKEEITIEHLLTMRAGWPWYDDDIDGEGSDEVQMFQHEDPLRFILERPLEWAPGSYMEYHSGSTVLLGEIVERVSGLSLADFAFQFLFHPLGIDEAVWADCQNAPGVAFAGGGLYLRPRDMAKIGQLFLQEGLWEGTQIISSEWASRSVQTVVVSQSQ